MLRVSGYSVWDQIHHTSNSEVYTGTRKADGRRVVLKVYRSSRCIELGRAELEFSLLQRIQSEGVVRPVEVVGSADTPVLVVERVAGYPLSRYAKGAELSVEDFLWIALGAARALADVHDARVIHKDIKLSNILVDPERMRICLIDFGIATEFGRAQEAAPPATAEGTMHYIAPEQTGRMGIGVDFRTDLYSFGASLYELLTGEPPFQAERAVDLVCAHMAQRPREPIELVPSIPVALSRIVMKLLEKDPELRYQTARGLATDFEQCAKQLELGGELDDSFETGTADGSDRLRFPSRLYGRESEVAALLASFRRVARGQTEWVFLSGPAGIGKSSLPGTIREPLLRAGGYLAEAKFDADRRERPYAGAAAGLEALLCQLLASSPECVATWGDRIRSGVGAIGGVLRDLAPSLRFLVDDFPAPPAVGVQEERERLSIAFCRLIESLARTEHPLALFFDDLQWADAGSLWLLTALARNSESGALLIVAGYRDNEVGPEHPVRKLIETVVDCGVSHDSLELGPLGLEHTAAMLADALGRTPAETAGLALRIGPKSQHNPLLIRRMVFHLWDRDLIRYQHGLGWVWDERELTEAEITEDVAGMVAERVESLPDRAKRLVKIASLVGMSFDLEMLVTLSGIDRLDLLQELMALVDQGLIAPCREGFKFVHDRIREAAHSALVDGERAKLHHDVARILLEKTPPRELSEVAFQLSDHLIGAVERLGESERQRALEVLSLAGTLSLSKGAPDSAAHYFGAARDLLCPADWEVRLPVAFGAYLHSAEAALQLHRFDAADAMLSELERRPLDLLQSAQLVATQVALSSVRLDGRSVDLALAGLRRFGVRLARAPSPLRTWIELKRWSWILRGPLDERTFRPADTLEPSRVGPILIIRAAAARMTAESFRLTALVTGHVLRSYCAHGIFESPSFVLSGCANLAIRVSHDIRRAQRYARAAEYWSAKNSSPVADSRSRYIVALLVRAWSQPRCEIVAEMELAAESSRELGDLEYSIRALHSAVSLAALSGSPLARVQESLRLQAGNPVGKIMSDAYSMLQVEASHRVGDELDLAEALAGLGAGELYAADHVLASLCFVCRWELGVEICERVWPRVLLSGALGSRLADYAFYRGIVHSGFALASSSRRSARGGHYAIVRASRRRLRRWARHGPDFVHMAALLEAEEIGAGRRARVAPQLYERAAKQALAGGYLHHAALSHERRAHCLRRLHCEWEAREAFATAMWLYEEWGAHAKVSELDRVRETRAG